MAQLKLPLGATFAPALTRLTTPLGGGEKHTLAIHLDLEALSPKNAIFSILSWV